MQLRQFGSFRLESPARRLRLKDFEQALENIRSDADERAIQEGCRKHVVVGLLRELREAGFVVSEPKLEEGKTGPVQIKAQRPSGAQAAFSVKLDRLVYKFDRYEGEACLQDANKVLPRLEDIYGIELGEESVTWRNPDLIGKSARSLPLGAFEASMK